jgi:acyl-CoA synthetase (AMP-forming)/AMP-acid ligase II
LPLEVSRRSIAVPFDFEASEYVNQRQLTIGEMLSRVARINPEVEAVIFEDRRYSYLDFDRRTDSLAAGLRESGISKTDKVAELFFNCSELLEAYFAVGKLGAVSVPLNFRLTGPDILYQVTDSESKMLIFGEEFTYVIDEIREQIPDVAFVCVGNNIPEYAKPFEEVVASGEGIPLDVAVYDDDPAFIMYTSGTTGKPKGAVLTHKNQMMNVLNCTIELLTVLEGLKQERVQYVAPLFHEAALAFALVCMSQASTLCIMKFFEPEKVVQQIQDEKITATLLVPVMTNVLVNMVDLSKYDTSSLRIYVSGAAILPSETRRQIDDAIPGLKLFDVFGQTEMSPVTTMLKPDDATRKTASVGLPVVNVEVRVVDDDDNDVPRGEVGEIVYRGPTTMKEYYRNPEATAETLKNGWFHSGDLVRQDEEGFVYVVGRKKDMIISGGENIYSAEIEDVLFEHPKVLEAAVIGIFDEVWGESVMAVVVPMQGEELTEEEIIDWCGARLASYKKPKRVDFTDELPKNAAMKVLKFELREKYGKSVRY